MGVGDLDEHFGDGRYLRLNHEVLAAQCATRHGKAVDAVITEFYRDKPGFGSKPNRLEFDRLSFDQPVAQILEGQGKAKASKGAPLLYLDRFEPILQTLFLALE